MMRNARPLAQITAEAMKILYREIGIVDTLRFINQYTAGYGDYTAQREELFAGMTLDSLVSEVKESRKRGRPRHGKEAQHKKTAPGKRIRKPQTGQHEST
jgi:NADH:ubiquinone oxidoreductase subunit F (NADH-binding)